MKTDRFVFGLSDFVPKSSKEKALSKLNDIVLCFTDEHKFDLDSLAELHDLIFAIEEVKPNA